MNKLSPEAQLLLDEITEEAAKLPDNLAFVFSEGESLSDEPFLPEGGEMGVPMPKNGNEVKEQEPEGLRTETVKAVAVATEEASDSEEETVPLSPHEVMMGEITLEADSFGKGCSISFNQFKVLNNTEDERDVIGQAIVPEEIKRKIGGTSGDTFYKSIKKKVTDEGEPEALSQEDRLYRETNEGVCQKYVLSKEEDASAESAGWEWVDTQQDFVLIEEDLVEKVTTEDAKAYRKKGFADNLEMAGTGPSSGRFKDKPKGFEPAHELATEDRDASNVEAPKKVSKRKAAAILGTAITLAVTAVAVVMNSLPEKKVKKSANRRDTDKKEQAIPPKRALASSPKPISKEQTPSIPLEKAPANKSVDVLPTLERKVSRETSSVKKNPKPVYEKVGESELEVPDITFDQLDVLGNKVMLKEARQLYIKVEDNFVILDTKALPKGAVVPMGRRNPKRVGSDLYYSLANANLGQTGYIIGATYNVKEKSVEKSFIEKHGDEE